MVHIDHLRNHHREHLGHIEVDNKALPKPIRAQLDWNNIQYVHAALVKSYKHLTSAINKTLYKLYKLPNSLMVTAISASLLMGSKSLVWG